MHASTTHCKTVLFLILFLLNSFSQEVTAEKKFTEFVIGFSAGANIATMFGSEIDELGKITSGDV